MRSSSSAATSFCTVAKGRASFREAGVIPETCVRVIGYRDDGEDVGVVKLVAVEVDEGDPRELGVLVGRGAYADHFAVECDVLAWCGCGGEALIGDIGVEGGGFEDGGGVWGWLLLARYDCGGAGKVRVVGVGVVNVHSPLLVR